MFKLFVLPLAFLISLPIFASNWNEVAQQVAKIESAYSAKCFYKRDTVGLCGPIANENQYGLCFFAKVYRCNSEEGLLKLKVKISQKKSFDSKTKKDVIKIKVRGIELKTIGKQKYHINNVDQQISAIENSYDVSCKFKKDVNPSCFGNFQQMGSSNYIEQNNKMIACAYVKSYVCNGDDKLKLNIQLEDRPFYDYDSSNWRLEKTLKSVTIKNTKK